jgi:predicted GIY-YIG superfamily endonuclease
MKQYWVYMLLCWDGSYCVGVTSRLDQRLEEHQSGIDRECFTRTRRPVLLVYSETFRTPGEAIAAEKRIKGWSRAKKRALIGGSWCEIRRLSRGSANADGAIVSHPSTGSG